MAVEREEESRPSGWKRTASGLRVERFAATGSLLLVLAVTASLEVSRGGVLAYDEAAYLERGFFHAHQVAAKRSLLLPRLVYSLGFEAPRPPLYHGLVALSALAVGERPLWVVVLATLIPLGGLGSLCWYAASRAGRYAGIFSVVALAAMPGLVEFAPRTMVEVTLATAVLGCAICARGAIRDPRWGAATGFGLAAGLALLTKMTAAMYVGPLAIYAAIVIARRRAPASALQFLAGAVLVAALVAIGWYLRNGRAAYEFAMFSADFPYRADAGAIWLRPLRALLDACGVVLSLFAVMAVMHGRRWRKGGSRAECREWGILAAVTLTPAAIIVFCAPYFEPRFLVPGLGPVVVWLGCSSAAAWRSGAVARKVLLGGGAALAVVVAWIGLWREPAAPMPWPLVPWLAGTTDGSPKTGTLCNVGSSPSWNVAKVRLASELAEGRRKRVVVDPPRQGRRGSTALHGCDWVFVLERSRIPAETSQIQLNEGYDSVAPIVDVAASSFEECESCVVEIGVRGSVRVFRRRGVVGP